MSALTWSHALIALAVLSGVSSGTTYAFSSFVMRGLGLLAPADAIRAMQAINVAAVHPAFLSVFIGTGLLALLVGAGAWASGATLGTAFVGSTLVYVVGVVGVTVVGNVPLNDALAAIDPSCPAGTAWTDYARPWLRWNHVRVVSAAIAAAGYIASATRF